jgi:predicted metal-dependent peptidase
MPKQNTTSNDALISADVDQSAIDAFDLSPHLIRLMWDEPFFATIMRVIKKRETKQVPTAGVYCKDGELNLVWNRKFLAGLSASEIKGLLKHEAYHIIFEHTTTRTQEPHIVWNYATDLAINSLIDEAELPEGGLIPGKQFVPLTPEQIEQMGQKAADRYTKVSALIASFPKEETSEWYFQKLMEDPDVAEAIQSQDKLGGKSLAQALADGDIKVDENGDLVDKDGNPVTLVPGNGDEHDGWGEMSDEQKDQLNGEIQEALRKAVEKCDGSNSWGSVGASMRGKLREMVSREIPWQAILKRFCGMSRRADRAASIRRINRKYAGIHPGAYRDYKANIAVYLDQSGSVSDSDLAMFAAELEGLAKRVTFTLFNFDTEVDLKSERELKKNRRVVLDRTRCGGTDFACVTKHVQSPAGKKFDGALILTDGYAPDPGICRTKLGWVICPTGSLQFPKKGRDFLIQMKAPKS